MPGRGSSSGDEVWAWAGIAEEGEEGRVGGGVVGIGISSTLGSFLRKVTGTSATRTSPEAARQKCRESLDEDGKSKNGSDDNSFKSILKTHSTALLVPRPELLRGEVGPSIYAGNGPGPAMWPAWNETTVAAFYGKMLGAVETQKKEYLI